MQAVVYNYSYNASATTDGNMECLVPPGCRVRGLQGTLDRPAPSPLRPPPPLSLPEGPARQSMVGTGGGGALTSSLCVGSTVWDATPRPGRDAGRASLLQGPSACGGSDTPKRQRRDDRRTSGCDLEVSPPIGKDGCWRIVAGVTAGMFTPDP